MKLDVKDTVLSSFSRIASKTTAGLAGMGIGLALILAAGFGGGAALSSMSGALSAIVLLITGLVYISGIAVLGVGGFRAYDTQDLKKEMFTENILWPFLRMMGANIILQSFIVTAMYLVIYPLALIGGFGSGLLMRSIGPSGAGASLYGIVAVIGVTIVALVLYIVAALTISLPRIAVNDKRMFQALDESVQATRGNRLQIILAYLPAAALIAAGIAALLLISGAAGTAAYIALAFASSFYGLGLLTELNNRL